MDFLRVGSLKIKQNKHAKFSQILKTAIDAYTHVYTYVRTLKCL